jgi:hypothetical protein
VKDYLTWIFFLGTIWDFVTSLLGIIGLFGVTDFQLQNIVVYITAVVGSLLIVGLSFNAAEIWDTNASDDYKWLRPVHVMSIAYDFYSSFLGTAQSIVLQENRGLGISIDFTFVWENTTLGQKVMLLFLSIMVTLSPIILSFRMKP